MSKPPTATTKLADAVHVGSRFGRSVNLERDFYDQVSLDGYVMTTTAREALRRIGEATGGSNASRAWTLTGSYGSGKSAFALFAAKALSPDPNGDGQFARNLIKRHDEELWHSLFDRRRRSRLGNKGLCAVLVSGSREPLSQALLRGMLTSIEHLWPRNPPLLHAQVRRLLKRAESGHIIHSRQIVELFESMARRVASSHKADGLFVVVDELGKLLEFAAAYPDRSDVFILQELAETTKCRTKHTIFVVAILHQAFDRYLDRLGVAQKEEWTKVQGRFEDVAFQEPTDQLLRVLSRAIEHRGPAILVGALRKHGTRLARRAWDLNLVPHPEKNGEEIEVLASCAPLHPITALLLGYLFRRIGQNERSLFAFLTSHEPCGFQQFIRDAEWNGKQSEMLRLDYLYDYIINAMGSGLYAQADGKKWAEIDAALRRLVDPTDLETRVIKSIGLLRIVGDIGSLKSSENVLQFALQDGKTNEKAIRAALHNLRERQVIIYRRFNDAFALWEGSDVSIEKRIKESRTQIDPTESLAVSLTKFFQPRPIVARRHSLQTGTLRYFDVRFVDLNSFEESVCEPFGDSDGRIVYGITLNADELRDITGKAVTTNMAGLPRVIVAIPQDTSGLREAIYDVACLRWIQENTPELEGDRAARNELQARLAQAESMVEQMLQAFLDTGRGCIWFRKGEKVGLHTERALQEYLSGVCDEIFHKAPILHNELINRRQISTTATSARRELIAAMLANAHKPALGIEGFPPHLSMYFSVLQETRIHREQGGRWGFFGPDRSTEPGIRAVWKAITDFLADTEIERRTVADLFLMLSKPPYGIKAGPLPVLLTAALLHYDTEVALYEQGSFVPSLSNAVFERLMKAYDKFHLQRCRIAGVRASVFERFADVLPQKRGSLKPEKMSLLTVVRPLTRFAVDLPNYTKHTQRLNPITLRVRNALFEAREPDKLLFRHIPEACDVAPFKPNDKRSTKEVDSFFRCLRESLVELQHTYDVLLNELESLLIAAFSLRNKGTEARRELATRSQALLELTVDPKLKGFLIRVLDDKLDLAEWIEGIATLLASKPPASWNDSDLARYEINLAEFTRSFRNIEALSFEFNKREGAGSGEMLRLGVTALREPECQRVVCISDQELSLVERAEESVERALSVGVNGNAELRLAILARLSRKLIAQIEEAEREESTKRFANRA